MRRPNFSLYAGLAIKRCSRLQRFNTDTCAGCVSSSRLQVLGPAVPKSIQFAVLSYHWLHALSFSLGLNVA